MAVGLLWTELGSTMRRARDEAGVSLREIETRGTWRRSTISQVETGKARPSRDLVRWYESELGTDGLLMSIYAAARSRQLVGDAEHDPAAAEDGLELVDVDPPSGLLVNCRARLQARITVRNTGRGAWQGRRLRRMGAFTGLRLIGSAPSVPVPDTAVGQRCEVVVDLTAPQLPGSAVAYWALSDDTGRESAPACPAAAVLLVAE